MSILHINARSISANYNNIIHFIDYIHKQFSIIIITETWLNYSNNKLYNLSNYNLTGINRSSCRGSCVLLYVSNYIDFENIDELCYTNKEICDMCIIKFKLKNSNIKYLISGIYRPPNSNINDFTDMFTNKFENYISDYVICIVM